MPETPTPHPADVDLVRHLAGQLIAPTSEESDTRTRWALARGVSCIETLAAVADELCQVGETLRASDDLGPERDLSQPADLAKFTPGDFVTIRGKGQRTDVEAFVFDQIEYLRLGVLEAMNSTVLLKMALDRRQPADPRAALEQRLARKLAHLGAVSPSALTGIRRRVEELAAADCPK